MPSSRYSNMPYVPRHLQESESGSDDDMADDYLDPHVRITQRASPACCASPQRVARACCASPHRWRCVIPQEDRPLLTMSDAKSSPGSLATAAAGMPYGNLDYPPTSSTGEKPGLTCVVPPWPFWQLFGLYRVGRIWVFKGENLIADMGSEGVDGERISTRRGPPKIHCAVGPCWMMLLLTYFLVLGISGALFSRTLPRVHWMYSVVALSLLLCSVIFT